jgi:hypothetical protein
MAEPMTGGSSGLGTTGWADVDFEGWAEDSVVDREQPATIAPASRTARGSEE